MERVWHRKASARLFENDLLEAVSKIPPYLPFVVYGPLVGGLMGWALWTGVTGPTLASAALLGGLATWQLMEYGLHRWLFHWEGIGPISRRFHWIIHGYHHVYPDDAQRLVMPLSASLPLAVVVWALLRAVSPLEVAVPWFSGIVLGYLWYDFLHWSVHARKPRSAWGRRLHAHHMAHHFADPDRNFGISHMWVDRLLRTLSARSAQSARKVRTADAGRP